MTDKTIKFFHSKKWPLIVLLSIFFLCFQILLIIHYGLAKPNLFMDEYWSYNLANSYYRPFLGNFHSAEYYNHWLTAQDWIAGLSVSPDHMFSYNTVIFNQSMDVHPPLFYFLLHTICSFFPGQFSRWFCLAPNIIFFILTQIGVFLSAKQVLKNDWLAVCSCVLYGFTWGAINTAVFLRMYMMLTFISIISFYVHLKFIKTIELEKNYYKLLVAIYFASLAGVMTQYYFLIFQFFLSCSILLYLFHKNKKKVIIHYSLVMAGMLASCVGLFPSILKQIAGKAGNQGIAFIGGYIKEPFFDRVHACCHAINVDLFGGKWFIAIIAVFFVVRLIFAAFHIEFIRSDHELTVTWAKGNIPIPRSIQLKLTTIYKFLTVFLCTGYFLVVSKVAPYLEPRYFYIIYPILVILFVDVLQYIVIGNKSNKIKLYCFLLIWFVGIGINVHQYAHDRVHFAAPSFAKVAERVADDKLNVIEINNNESWWPIFPQYKLFKNAPFSYLSTDSNLSRVIDALETMPGKQDAVLIIKSNDSKIKDEDLLQFLVKNTEYKHYDKLYSYFGNIYYFSKP